jgi:integrase
MNRHVTIQAAPCERDRIAVVFTEAVASEARRRLIDDYGAPPFQWSTRNSRPGSRSFPTLRSTCGSYLACAPSIYKGSSATLAAAQLGHSVQVAERHYIGTLRRIPTSATTLEAAMEIEDMMREIPRMRVVK